jgi:hypothetical protein
MQNEIAQASARPFPQLSIVDALILSARVEAIARCCDEISGRVEAYRSAHFLGDREVLHRLIWEGVSTDEREARGMNS